MELFDSHCHLDDERFEEDREEIIEKIKESGVTKLVSAGYSIEGSRKGVELSKKYEFIYTTLKRLVSYFLVNWLYKSE